MRRHDWITDLYHKEMVNRGNLRKKENQPLTEHQLLKNGCSHCPYPIRENEFKPYQRHDTARLTWV
jgi:hypothetical protein